MIEMKSVKNLKNHSLDGFEEKRYEKLRLTIISLILLSVFIKMSTHNSAVEFMSVISTSLILILSSVPLLIGFYYRQYRQVLQYGIFITLSIITAAMFVFFVH